MKAQKVSSISNATKAPKVRKPKAPKPEAFARVREVDELLGQFTPDAAGNLAIGTEAAKGLTGPELLSLVDHFASRAKNGASGQVAVYLAAMQGGHLPELQAAMIANGSSESYVKNTVPQLARYGALLAQAGVPLYLTDKARQLSTLLFVGRGDQATLGDTENHRKAIKMLGDGKTEDEIREACGPKREAKAPAPKSGKGGKAGSVDEEEGEDAPKGGNAFALDSFEASNKALGIVIASLERFAKGDARRVRDAVIHAAKKVGVQLMERPRK